MLSHLGPIALPGFDILELTLTTVDGWLQIAGKAQREPNDPRRGTWHWQGGHWWHFSHQAHGSYSALFDRGGNLHLATPAHGVDGLRYVREDGLIVTGDQTYNGARWAEAGFTPAVEGLSQFTYLGGVFIGQGETGCDVLIDGQRRRLLDGDTRFIRVTYDSTLDMWGIGITRLREGDAFVFFLGRAALRALPAVTTIPAPPPPPPTTEPPKMTELEIVQQVRAKYPTPLGTTHAACLIEIAQTLGGDAGLLRKDSGTTIVLPDGTRVAQDIIAYPNGDHYDCLGDAENEARPGWGYVGKIDPARYYRVAGSVPEPPTPPVPSPPDTELIKRVERLEALLTRLIAEGILTAKNLTFKP